MSDCDFGDNANKFLRTGARADSEPRAKGFKRTSWQGQSAASAQCLVVGCSRYSLQCHECLEERHPESPVETSFHDPVHHSPPKRSNICIKTTISDISVQLQSSTRGCKGAFLEVKGPYMSL